MDARNGRKSNELLSVVLGAADVGGGVELGESVAMAQGEGEVAGQRANARVEREQERGEKGVS